MIKKISLLVAVGLLVITAGCKKENTEATPVTESKDIINVSNSSTPVPADGKYPVITFEEEEYDFGTIKQGNKVVHDFKFKNTGEADLLITSARGSCGGTVPEPPKQAIKPGETETIKVSFNSAGKHGETSKTVTLLCNTKEGNKILKIKANIEVPAKD
jgi:hypothetical protein